MKKSGRPYHDYLQQVHECLMSVDEGVGNLIQALRETNQLENTLVVYTSDQGFANGEFGLKQKVAPYDVSYASPLIISQPGTLPAGQYCSHAVNAPDLVVTFFSQAGIELPWEMHGRDFSSLMTDPETAQWNDPTLYTQTGQDYGSDVYQTLRTSEARHAGVPYFAAVVTGTWKYIRYLQGNEPEELYDLETDPEELTNLSFESDSVVQLERMRTILDEELRRTGADFVDVGLKTFGTE